MNMTPTVSFKDSYKKIYNMTISGSTVTIGTSRGVLDNLQATVSLRSDGTCKIELVLKGKVERLPNSRAAFSFYIYIYDADGKIVNQKELYTTKTYYEVGEEISIYKTIYNLPYSTSYTVKLSDA